MKSDKFWLAVLGGVLLISAAVAILIRLAPAARASVYMNGTLIESLDLNGVSAPFSFTVDSGEGTNVISVERGRIRVSEADCPDGSCIRQGWLSDGLLPVVCLPHRLVIKLDGAASEIDAVVG